jgi:hypothetical protein
MTEPGTDRRIGGAAVAAGLLLGVSVAAELVHPVQRTDGTLTEPFLFAAYLAVWTVGAAALVRALVLLRPPGGAGRVGAVVSLAGAVLLLAFGLVVVGSALVTGQPYEASFLAFALGLLLSAIGAVLLALGLRRSGAIGGWWRALPVVALGLFVALLAPGDPWHDLGLFLAFGAWAALGLGLLRGARRSVAHVSG